MIPPMKLRIEETEVLLVPQDTYGIRFLKSTCHIWPLSYFDGDILHVPCPDPKRLADVIIHSSNHKLEGSQEIADDLRQKLMASENN